MTEEKDYARVDEQPLTGSAELPQRPTGEASSTAPEEDNDDFEPPTVNNEVI